MKFEVGGAGAFLYNKIGEIKIWFILMMTISFACQVSMLGLGLLRHPTPKKICSFAAVHFRIANLAPLLIFCPKV